MPSRDRPVRAPPPFPSLPPDVQYNQVLQAVLLAQFEMQGRPGETRADINLPDDIVDRALLAWQQQQQVGMVGRGGHTGATLQVDTKRQEVRSSRPGLQASNHNTPTRTRTPSPLSVRLPSCHLSSWR